MAIPANEVSTSTLRATVTDQYGNAVADGTEVTFATSLGSLGSGSVVKTTVNGVATAILISSTTAGLATVTATCDGKQDQTQVYFYLHEFEVYLPLILKNHPTPPCGWNDPDDEEPYNDLWKDPDIPYGSGLFISRTFWSPTQSEGQEGNDPDWFQWKVDWTGTHWLWTQGLDPGSLRIKLFVCQPTADPCYPMVCEVMGESYGPGELGVWLEQGQTYYVLVSNLTSPEVGCYSLWLEP